VSVGTAVPTNTKKERLSLAYINAVAARAGYEALPTAIDIDSIDGVLRSTTGRRPQIDFQAKATSTDVVGDDDVTFDLSVKNYNDLRAETVNPRLLILFVMPSDEELWMSLSQDELVLRHCGYWLSLRGMPDTENSTKIKVRIPREQVFDVNQLTMLMGKAEAGPIL
jgi:Domain of unknown function (DUF4365)